MPKMSRTNSGFSFNKWTSLKLFKRIRKLNFELLTAGPAKSPTGKSPKRKSPDGISSHRQRHNKISPNGIRTNGKVPNIISPIRISPNIIITN